jgi:signal transduction histidine kinase
VARRLLSPSIMDGRRGLARGIAAPAFARGRAAAPAILAAILTLLLLLGAAVAVGQPAGTRTLPATKTQWSAAWNWRIPSFPLPGRRGGVLALGPLGASEELQFTTFAAGLDRSPADLGIMMDGIEGDAVVFVSGARIGSAIAATGPYLSRPGARSAVWRVPPHFVRPGLNRIDVLLRKPVLRGLGAAVMVGPPAVLTARAERAQGLARWLRPAVLLAAAAAVLFGLVGAALERGAPAHLAIAAASAAAGARAWLQAVPGDRLGDYGPAIDLLLLAAMLSSLALAMTPRLGRVFAGLAAAVIAAGAVALAAASASASWSAFVAATAVGLSAILALRAAVHWIQLPLPGDVAGRAGRGLAAVLVPALVVSGTWAILAPPLVALPLSVEVVHGLAATGLLVLAVVITGQATVRSAITLGKARLDLGVIVRRQREEIRDTALALEQEARRTAVLEERQRFARDVHDGIGGHIASLIARVRSRRIDIDQLEGELVGGLAELRLLVDSLDAAGESLSQALAAFHARMLPQIEAAGMTLEWRQPNLMDIETQDPRWILNLYRLLQEAIANAVQHSGADRLLVAIDNPSGRRLTIRVEDNGEGLDPAHSSGRGLANMAHRAGEMGALFEIGPGRDGRGAAVLLEVDVPPVRSADGDQSNGAMIPR